MKRISKPGAIIWSASLICLLLVPAAVSAIAAKTAAAAAAANTVSTSPFCSALPSKAATITNQVSKLSTRVTQAWAQQAQKIAADEQQVDQKVANVRKQADTIRSNNFTKLQAKAKTTSEKQAVQTYEAAVNAAINTRRDAYDTARTNFRNNVNSTVNSRHDTVNGQVDTFQSSVNLALNTAESSCGSNPASGATIKTTLQTALQSARVTFQGERKDDAKIGTQVQQLAVTRDAAFKSADQTFETATAAAGKTLQQAFGKTSV